MQMLYRLLEVFSRLVSEDEGICWADGRSSGAALTPDPPQMSQTQTELSHEAAENQLYTGTGLSIRRTIRRV